MPLDPAKTYRVGTNNYMRGGGDGYKVFETKAQNAYDFGPSLETRSPTTSPNNRPTSRHSRVAYRCQPERSRRRDPNQAGARPPPKPGPGTGGRSRHLTPGRPDLPGPPR